MPERLRSFLSSLPDPERRPIGARDVAVVVAHPDDETIGCGALLRRLDGVSVVVVTDGAPRNLVDARVLGLETATAYAAVRHREFADALAICGVSGDQLVELAVPDQEASFRIPAIARSLVRVFRERGTALVLTHAYEGGHPDHDATALAVSIAVRSTGVAVVEMPFYRLGPNGMLPQSFDGSQIEIPLAPAERELKRQMIAAHATQKRTLAQFKVEFERFRPAPEHDFSILPNGGRLLYDNYDWGVTGNRWLELAQAGLAECGLLAVPT